MYKDFAKNFKVYVFSRKNRIRAGYSTRDMAKDTKLAMDKLGITSASIMGVSQGGMIAQYIAIDYPSLVEKLVLAVTLARPNEIVNKAVSPWITMAQNGDYKRIIIDTAEKSYSNSYLRTHRWLFPLLGITGKPKDFTRFIIQANSCLQHNAYEQLAQIQCPTLVIGGGDDKIVGVEASKEIAEKIYGSDLIIYDKYGHAAYEEEKDFNAKVIDFLRK
jgi:pimeloyl-ACP methyl ester carboxylesterase